MATLSSDTPRVFENTGGHPDVNEIPIIASDIVYAGAAVGESGSTGTGRPLVGGDNYMGFATEKCDNASGAASAKNIEVLQSGVAKLTVVGVASAGDYDATVYATDDNTFTLTSSGASAIGKVKRWITSTTCMVYFEATSKRSI